jgi:isoquinoline 1-oxidoreductase beta subunit
MSGFNKIARRDFLIASTSVGVGLVFGLYLKSKWNDARGGKATTFSPDVWLQIAPDSTVRISVSKSEMGQGVRTALAMLVAEELEADWSTIRVQQAPTDNVYGDERTQGSSSVRTLWIPLSRAGATAREMLITAAAQAWEVDRDTCRADSSYIIHRPTGRRMTYGELSSATAALPIPRNVPLKKSTEYRLLGKPVLRLDSPSKINGGAIFGIDIRVPGMLYATVLRCPYIGGSLRAFDARRAKAVPGVHHVLKTLDGVAVVADATWSALQGRSALEVEWDRGPNASLSEDSVRKILEQSSRSAGSVARNEGDVDQAIAAAHRIVETTFELPYLAHAAMEPMNCTAHVHWNRCEIWCSTQNPAAVQRRAARIALLPLTWVDVYTTLIGGGFGRRLENDMVADAVQLSKATGKPVQVVWTREDDIQHDFYRPAAYSHMVAALDATGKPTAWRHRLVSQSINSQFGSLEEPDTTSVQGASDLPYAIPNIRVDYVAPLLPVPVGYWRSVGYSLNAFSTECFMDEVAAAAGKDPCEFRIGLLRNSPRGKAVLELVAEKSNWGETLPAGKGMGIALHTSYRTTVAQVAEVSTATDGSVRVERVVCAIDCGRIVNPDTIKAQIEGGIAFGLSAALWGNITLKDGQVQESNFDSYRVLRISEMPQIDVHIVPSVEPPTGVGEVAVPPIAPAVTNALFAATGKRISRLPIMRI